MAKEILFNSEAREKVKIGIDKVANAVKSTLGPQGKTVMISKNYGGETFVTKDGFAVAESIYLPDEIENAGAELIKRVASKTVKDCGDATTTATVLAQFIITEGIKQVTAGHRSQDVKRGMEKAVGAVVNKIKAMAIQVGNDNDKIKNIATISANNDEFIGNLIAEAFSKIGNDGILKIDDSNTAETNIKVVDGVEFLQGYMSGHFAVDKEKMQTVFENPLILVTEHTITLMKDVVDILEKAIATGKGIVIFASDIEGEAFQTLLTNVVRGGLKICLIRATSAYKKEMLEDVATLTGATLISDDSGLKLGSAKIEYLGSCEKIIITQGTTTILKGKGKKEDLEQRKNEIRVQIKETKHDEVREVLNHRLARISGSIGFINVGASTDVELKEKKDRIDDAVRSTKSAIEEGVLPGGGVALINCIDELKNIETANEDESVGVSIIAKCLEVPLAQILENADIKDNSIVLKIKSGSEKGYNAKTMKFEDLMQSGVIDSAKAVRSSLQNAASVAGAVITSQCLIVETRK